MESSRSIFFSCSGHQGFVITQGSISATCLDAVVRENVLWPKYVIWLPLVLSTGSLQRCFKLWKFARASSFLTNASSTPSSGASESPLHRFRGSFHRQSSPPASRPLHRKTTPATCPSILAALPGGMAPHCPAFCDSLGTPACTAQ